MTRRTLVIMAFLSIFTSALAQVRVDGEVVNKENEPISFVSVTMKSLEDTTFVRSTVSDFEGHYTFSDMNIGRYELRLQAMGYITKCDTLVLEIPSSGYAVTRQDTLEATDYMLQGVTIMGTDTRQKADHRSFTFSSKELSSAYDSFELMKYLPNMRVDLESGGVKGLQGGEVLILINGQTSTYNDVKLIPKGKIKRMEMYDIPPARYQDVECVVNIITSPLDDGVVGGIELQNAVTTGFGNDYVYFALNRGKNKLTVEYMLNYRNYNHRTFDTEYNYTLANEDHTLLSHERSKFGYTTHTPEIKYSFVDFDKTIVEISAQPVYNHDFDHSSGDGTYQVGINSMIDDLTTSSEGTTNTWQPSIDAYLWKRLSKKDELSINAVATFFDVKRDGLDVEMNTTADSIIYYDDRYLHNNKTSFIGEVAYIHSFSFANWNSGYRINVANLHSTADNEFGNFDYRSHFLTQYAYTELSGKHRNLLYRLSLGLTHVVNSSAGTKVKDLQFTPKAVLGYTFGARHSIRLIYERRTISPDINDLSSNISNVSIDILSTGNPNLKNSILQSITALYGYNHDYIDLGVAVEYEYTSRPIVTYFEEDSGKYWRKKVNGKSLKDYGAMLYATVKPLGDRSFQLTAQVYPHRTTLKAEQMNYSLTAWENSFSASYNNKFLSVLYQVNIPVYQVQGAYRSRVENSNHLNVAYKYKNWRFSAGLMWIGMPSRYETETVPGSKVYYHLKTNIYNNKNMVTLGITYRFQTGKDKEYSKNLHNADNSTPTF